LNTNLSDLLDVTPEQAANHPNWNMGKRISIDSASMFNKAMELKKNRSLNSSRIHHSFHGWLY